VVVVVFLGLTLLQNDYSTMLFLAVCGPHPVFCGGDAEAGILLFWEALALPLSLIYLFVEEYRVLRILNFMDPSSGTQPTPVTRSFPP
jgi:cell division protein FtsW (lipid II flippase)